MNVTDNAGRTVTEGATVRNQAGGAEHKFLSVHGRLGERVWVKLRTDGGVKITADPSDYGLTVSEDVASSGEGILTNRVHVFYVSHQGAYRIHGAGCADIPRDRARYGTESIFEAGETVQKVAEAELGDVCGDTNEIGSKEWAEECLYSFEANAKWLPCCSA